jgi:hypothetical protein
MIEKTLDITTKDGEMETFVCHPERNGPSPAVFLLMDAHGIREELKDMARRLGTQPPRAHLAGQQSQRGIYGDGLPNVRQGRPSRPRSNPATHRRRCRYREMLGRIAQAQGDATTLQYPRLPSAKVRWLTGYAVKTRRDASESSRRALSFTTKMLPKGR